MKIDFDCSLKKYAIQPEIKKDIYPTKKCLLKYLQILQKTIPPS